MTVQPAGPPASPAAGPSAGPGAGGSRAVPAVLDGPGGTELVALFDVDPDLIAARVLACPGVAGLSAGPWGSAATYLPGRRVVGVRLSPTAVEVHLVARYGLSLGELAAQVRAALAGQVGARQVDIVVEDVAEPSAQQTAPPQPVTAAAAPATAVQPAVLVEALPAPAARSTAVPERGQAQGAPGRTSRWRRSS